MESKQQKARDNSLQLQVENINVGLTETEVENMLKRDRELLMKDMQILAIGEMDKRLSMYGDVALKKIVKAEVINAFSDPSIQIFLRDTEKAAVSSERELDYEVLSELLIHRVENKNNYTKKAALKKAVENIPLVSDEALLGMTLLYLAENLYPTSGDIEDGLRTLNDTFKIIIGNNKLPEGDDWINNLEILGLIKIIPFTSRKTLVDYYLVSLNGYLCVGINKQSEKYVSALEKIKSVNLPTNILCENIMIENHVRLPICRLKQFDNLRLFDKMNDDEIIYKPINEEQKNVLESICDDYDKNPSALNDVKNKFKSMLNDYPELQKVITWWDGYIKKYISLDLSGEVLAHCNAKRLNNELPDQE